MLTKWVWLVVASVIFSASGGGTDAPSLQGPILGYSAWQSPPMLRPLRGVPGAAVSGDPLMLPTHATKVHVAPGQRYAILERAGQPPAVLPLEGSTHDAIVSIPGVMQAPETVWFSPSGSSAVLASNSTGHLQIVAGLPLSPKIIRDSDGSHLPGFPDTIAVSDSGSSLLFGALGAVYSLQPDDSSALILSVMAEPAIAFLPQTDVAAIGDPKSGAVTLFRGLSAGLSPLATGLTGLSRLAASFDGRLLLVTSHAAPRAWTIDMVTGAVTESLLPVIPEKLDALRSADTFLISSKPGEPIWIAFRRAESLATVFVPAAVRDPQQYSK